MGGCAFGWVKVAHGHGLDLPDEVLKKLYYKNALKIIPGLSKAGFPD